MRATRLILIGILWAAALLSEGFAMPDLVVNRGLLERTVVVEKRRFSPSGCEYREGCIRGYGVRKILRVELGMANIGSSDLVIGNPANRPGIFDPSPCHGHPHIRGLAKYRLLNLQFQPVIAARKQGFCLRDNERYRGTAGESSGYDCDNQGITAGWQDVYDETSPCQYIDVTGVPPGRYYLEVTVNPNRVLRESNYRNNTVRVLIRIPR